jgi:hypothetical protein
MKADLIIYGIIALCAVGGWAYMQYGWCNHKCEAIKGEYGEYRADVEAKTRAAEARAAADFKRSEAASAAASAEIRRANSRANQRETVARAALARLGAVSDLPSVRCVLDNDSCGGAAEAQGAPQGDVGATDPAVLARRLTACQSALTVTTDTFAVNRANHERCIGVAEACRGYAMEIKRACEGGESGDPANH